LEALPTRMISRLSPWLLELRDCRQSRRRAAVFQLAMTTESWRSRGEPAPAGVVSGGMGRTRDQAMIESGCSGCDHGLRVVRLHTRAATLGQSLAQLRPGA